MKKLAIKAMIVLMAGTMTMKAVFIASGAICLCLGFTASESKKKEEIVENAASEPGVLEEQKNFEVM